MDRNLEEAKRKLATFAHEEEVHIFTWGCKHFMTNGEFLERYEKDACLAKLKTYETICHFHELETNFYDYYTEPTKEDLLEFMNLISKKVFNMTSIETCEYIYRRLNSKYLKRGVSVLIGRDLLSIESKEVLKIHIPLICHFGIQIQIIILIS